MPYTDKLKQLEYFKKYNTTRRAKSTCIECGKIIGGSKKYCLSCSKKGTRNGNWKHGKLCGRAKCQISLEQQHAPRFCKNCGKRMGSRSKLYCSICCRIPELNPLFKGDDVGMNRLHQWIRKNKSKPEFCEQCNKNRSYDVANISGEYHRDPTDYRWLCRTCHMKSDGRMEKLKEQASHAGLKRIETAIRDGGGKFCSNICPDCGNKINHASGCKECSCGWSACL
jgi:hypothetical protein